MFGLQLSRVQLATAGNDLETGRHFTTHDAQRLVPLMGRPITSTRGLACPRRHVYVTLDRG